MADLSFPIPTDSYELEGNSVYLDEGDKNVGCHSQWIDIDDAMQMLGTNDEDVVQALIYEISALITAYLGRNLLWCTHTDLFFRPRGKLYLENYPVLDWHSMRFDGTRAVEGVYEMDSQLGVIVKGCYSTYDPYVYCGKVTVNYDAGYVVPPLELQSMFRAILVDYYNSGGSTQGSVGSIKKVSLTGVAAVEFNTTGISYSGVDRQQGVPNVLKNYTGLLDRYKSDRTMGVI